MFPHTQALTIKHQYGTIAELCIRGRQIVIALDKTVIALFPSHQRIRLVIHNDKLILQW